MSRPARQSTLREWQAHFASQRLWATFAIVVFVFTVTGPFGTLERLNGWMRFGYWLVLQAAAWLTAMTAALLVRRIFAERVQSIPLHLAASSLPAGVLIAAEVELVNYVFFGLLPDARSWAANLVVSVPLCALISLLAALTAPSTEPALSVPPAPGPLTGDAAEDPVAVAAASAPSGGSAPAPVLQASIPLLKRLKPENRGPLYRLAAEDHYTRIVTAAGSELLLLRFADALAELGTASGLKVHRSHWVADEAVVELQRDGQRALLILKDGSEVPVSRSHAGPVRQRYASA